MRVETRPAKPRWTSDEDIRLEKMWCEEGRSAGQISNAIGRSRNSVISRVHRLGLVQGRPGVRATGLTEEARASYTAQIMREAVKLPKLKFLEGAE